MAAVVELMLSASPVQCDTGFEQDGAIWLPQNSLPFAQVSQIPNASEKQILLKWMRQRKGTVPTPFEQEQFVVQLERYSRHVSELRSLLRKLSDYSNNFSAEWMKKDARILPFLKRAISNRITLAARDVLRCHQTLASMVSPELLREIEMANTPGLSWAEVKAYAGKPAYNQPYEGFDMREYDRRAVRTFWNELIDAKLGPSPGPLLLAKIDRDGGVVNVEVMETNGAEDYAAALVKVAAKLKMSPLPLDYKGDHWYVLLQQDPTPISRNLRYQPTSPSNSYWAPSPAAPISTRTYATPPSTNVAPTEEQKNQASLSAEQQQLELENKKRVFGIQYPWEMVTPYAGDWTRPRADTP